MARASLSKPKERILRVIHIASYIPRKCGIATYTKDLTNAINVLNPYSLAEILAISENAHYDYPWEVKYRINQNDLQGYLDAAKYINQSGAQLVHLQHEFGLNGGSDGEYIIYLISEIKKPLICTFHTVLDKPTSHQQRIIEEIAQKSVATVVMVRVAAQRLRRVYDIPKRKIATIPHGVPDIPYGPTLPYKRMLNLPNKKIIGAINLLSRNKGFEYVIEALPKIIKEDKEVLFLLIGETHPVVKKIEGESYRNELTSLVKKLNLQKHVQFINRYVTLDELVNYLRAIDIYVTPYLESSQTASGTLSYALGAGKACVSTPYLYAREVLSDNRGTFVKFKDSKSIAEAVVRLFAKDQLREDIQKKAYLFGRTMIWPNVALRHLDLYSLMLERAKKKRR